MQSYIKNVAEQKGTGVWLRMRTDLSRGHPVVFKYNIKMK